MIRYILRNINIMNMLLACLLALLLSYGLYPLFSRDIGLTLTASKKAAVVDEEKAPASETLPVLSDYVVIAEKNLFHPERIIPVEKKEEKPLPKPDFVLYGTILDEQVKKVFMDDLKVPYSTPGRGKRQRVLKQGDRLSGFTLKQIMTDRVVMVRGEEVMEVRLDDQKGQRGKAADLASAAPVSAQTPSPAKQPAETAIQRQATPQTQPAQTFRPSPEDMRKRFRSIKR